MPLTISIATASAELKESAIARAITALAMQLAAARQAGLPPSQPSLDVTFLLPGRDDKPSFTGMRMGGYTDDQQTLYFERAVEERMLHSPQSADYLALVLQDVIDNADDFFRDSPYNFDSTHWRELLSRLNADAVAPAGRP